MCQERGVCEVGAANMGKTTFNPHLYYHFAVLGDYLFFGKRRGASPGGYLSVFLEHLMSSNPFFRQPSDFVVHRI